MVWKPSSLLLALLLFLAGTASGQSDEETFTVPDDSTHLMLSDGPETVITPLRNDEQQLYESAKPSGKKLDEEALKDRLAGLDYSEKKPKEEKPEEKKRKPRQDIEMPSFGSWGGLKNAAYIIAFLLLAAVVVYLFYRVGNMKPADKKSKPLAGLAEWEDAWSLDAEALDMELQNAVENGNYKLAIRLLYLRGLKQLMDKGIVKPSPEKTNSQYMAEVRKAQLHNPFRYCTLVYETVWYGDATPDQQQYKSVLPGFHEFSDKIRQA